MTQIIIIIFCMTTLFGNLDEELRDVSGPLFISLGSNCEAAMRLKESNLRAASFPFDWILTLNHDRLIDILDHNFENFIDRAHLIKHPTQGGVVYNTRYDVEFVHDEIYLDFWDNSAIQKIVAKINRRIERFKNLDNYSGKVFFFRTPFDPLHYGPPLYQNPPLVITKPQAEELKNALTRLFPNLDFTLVIINYLDKNTSPIEGIDKVIEFIVDPIRIPRELRAYDYQDAFDYLISNPPIGQGFFTKTTLTFTTD